MRAQEARESTDKQHADGEQKDGGSVPFADFIPKWPLTRGERIKELDRLQPLFEHTSQRDNIIAMKAWHARFPSDQVVPEETVWFERGKKVEKDDIVAGQCEVWEEVSQGLYPICEMVYLKRSILGTPGGRFFLLLDLALLLTNDFPAETGSQSIPAGQRD